jgi:uncharacterized protein YjbJ (UPF0337 family)
MRSSTKDKIKGLADKIKGNVKERFGSLSGNRDIEKEGKSDQLKGAVREKVGKGAAGCSTHLINLIHETRKRGYP